MITPEKIKNKLPLDLINKYHIEQHRNNIRNIIHKKDNRLLVICGPCSIHDIDSAVDYADRLISLSKKLNEQLYIVMRVYFEKPRSNIGWKGLINDPYMDKSFDIEHGLHIARNLLLVLTKMNIPLATELLDPNIFQYINDLFSWVAIGARTTESQIHREIASSLSIPVGFKNGTDGNIMTAINAIKSAETVHKFSSIDQKGKLCFTQSKGNLDSHIILRGGIRPNYYPEDIKNCEKIMEENTIEKGLIVDCSHGNSNKEYMQQFKVVNSIVKQIKSGNNSIIGIMLESNINSGNQLLKLPKNKMLYGVSITDACIDWNSTEKILENVFKEIKGKKCQLIIKDKEKIKLEELRKKINKIDTCLVDLIFNRLELVSQIGKIKNNIGLSIFNPIREKEIINFHRNTALQIGISPDLIEDIMRRLIRESYILESKIGFKKLNKSIRYIVVIGGKGRMGSLFCKMLILSGYSVKVLNREDWKQSDIILSNPSMVIISVPINLTKSVIEKLPLLPKDCILVDVTSIKKEPLNVMLMKHSGPVLGLHPIFSPNSSNLVKQVVIYCDGRNKAEYKWFLDQIKLWGIQLQSCNAIEHDRNMSFIQGLNHFSTFVHGISLLEEKLNLEQLINLSSPIYRLELLKIKRLFEQDPKIFIDIIMYSKIHLTVIKNYQKKIGEIIHLLEKENRKEFNNYFRKVYEWIKEYKKNIFEDSQKILEYVNDNKKII